MNLEITSEEKEQLMKEYPFLRNGNYCWFDSIPSGWRKIVKNKLPKIKNRLIEINKLDTYKISDIKEKWGFLRWYDNSSDEIIISLIGELEKESEHTCIICGNVAKWISLGWISPYCDDCKNYLMKKMPEDYNKPWEPIQ